MCGRFSLTKTPEELESHFNYKNRANLKVRYNVAPTQAVASIKLNDKGLKEVKLMRWGLIPQWKKKNNSAKLIINARAESVATKMSFKEAFLKRRCLVPCDGFYEWRDESGRKQGFRIGMKGGKLFAFAGIYQYTNSDNEEKPVVIGERKATLAIITTNANAKLSRIHHRMPVILSKEHYDKWLFANHDSSDLLSLLIPYPEETMVYYRVGEAVNNVKNDNPEVIRPLLGQK
tara:strand:+ start:5872 stop:6567 length:696 start_codon:yes stop_codon:yes gene_type:complete